MTTSSDPTGTTQTESGTPSAGPETVVPDRSASEPSIIVGLDGSPGSNAALAWAVDQTKRFGLITPVATWLLPWWASGVGAPGVYAPPPTEELQAQAVATLEEQVADVDPEKLLPPIVTHGRPGKVLVDVAQPGDLLVVGTRGRGAIADTLLGSVSTYVASHARCPVAIVPSHSSEVEAPARVVVGADGSDTARNALDWAIENTDDDIVIDVVHAWSLMPISGFETTPTLIEQLRDGAEALAATIVADAIERHQLPAGRISGRAEAGDARNVLRNASEGAQLLVVGAMGHRGVAHLLLGSVATALVHQPALPIVVVPNAARQ